MADQTNIITLIRGNPASRAKVVRELANNKALLTKITTFIEHNSGSKDDALSIFHDSIIAFVKKVFSDNTFTLSSSVDAYLFGIAKLMWYTKLKENKKDITLNAEEINTEQRNYGQFSLDFDSSEKKAILHKILQHLRKNCREVLMYWAGGYSMIEIANLLGYKSEGMARKKKCECFKELVDWLHSNPQYLAELKY